ncbi:MAG: hypothetical protein MI723_18885, partial [Caulobacterales bacterium]|nr:hypothetical protein [Caulobacterales bacterium]
MAADIVLLTVLHILVFAYWLGGDLGAFYASTILVDPARSVEARAAAAQTLNAVDLAPRLSLIFAAPTGFALAIATGWLPDVAPVWGWAAFAAAGLWSAAAVSAHLRHGPAGRPWARADGVIRLAALATLTLAGGAILAGLFAAPLFIGAKALLLAAAMALGLGVRVALRPFGPAFATLLATGASEQVNADIAGSLKRARVLV